jgi:hypothetical protein
MRQSLTQDRSGSLDLDFAVELASFEVFPQRLVESLALSSASLYALNRVRDVPIG